MKKNIGYMQTCTINELTKVFSMQKIAEALLEVMNNKKDVDVTIYETSDDGFVIRRKKEGVVSDNTIITCMEKALRKIAADSDELQDILTENYDFEYSKDLITEEFLTGVVQILSSGRLISVEFDLQ